MSSYLKIFVIIVVVGLTGCGSSDPTPQINCVETGPELIFSTTPTTTCTSADGVIIADVTNPDEGIVYIIDGGDENETGIFEGLIAGVYTIEAKSLDGCSDSKQVTVNAGSSLINISNVSVNTNAGCQTSNGSVSITASGVGTILYSVTKSGTDNFQNNSTVSGLSSGDYNVAVKDDDGCVERASVTILNGTSYNSQVKEIITANCAIKDCHNGDDSSIPNFTIFSNVKNRAEAIKSRTQSGNMPPRDQPDLTPGQIALIACWVDDGARNN